MLNILKNVFQLIAPVDGQTISLSKVPNEIFALKVAGDGIAIDSTGDIVSSPIDGKVAVVFETNHAFVVVNKQGVECLVHIGIDTIELNGTGFHRLVNEGDDVKSGDPIINIDRDIILEHGYSLITPVIITNTEKIKKLDCFEDIEVKCGQDIILTYKIN
jgi:glucose-specific phosphotransferase system IIA component